MRAVLGLFLFSTTVACNSGAADQRGAGSSSALGANDVGSAAGAGFQSGPASGYIYLAAFDAAYLRNGNPRMCARISNEVLAFAPVVLHFGARSQPLTTDESGGVSFTGPNEAFTVELPNLPDGSTDVVYSLDGPGFVEAQPLVQTGNLGATSFELSQTPSLFLWALDPSIVCNW
jgi:hypothetical protein